MTKNDFIYALKASGCLYHNGQTYYEENELIRTFEDMEMFEEEKSLKDMTELEHAIKHIKTRADAWAVREVEQALEQMPEVTSTMQTGQFDYVPIRETKGISCSECKYFKVTQEPLRGTGGLIDLGQARCEKHDLITDFAHKGKFKHLKPCEYFVDFKEGDKE